MQRRSALRYRILRLHLLPILVTLLALSCGAVPASAVEKYAAIVVDGNTGETLFARNADAKRFPASLTKMMTLYLLFGELESGRFSLDSKLSVSAHAAAQAPSKLGLRAGKTIKVEDAILALTTKSANDAAVVVAENVGGSVSGFAASMNRTARALGMNSTTFRNPNGLPDPGQTTTARDFVRLATALQERYPTYYKYFGARSFTYAGKPYRNHNRLLGSVEGVDGIKTGYTRASGFNLVSNVRRGDRHLIAVVMGGKTGASRDAHMRQLIAKYFPAAKRGNRTAPLLIASSGDVGGDELASPEAGAEKLALEWRLPRARPAGDSEPALAFAAPQATRDIVSAAMAMQNLAPARVPGPTPAPAPALEQGDVADVHIPNGPAKDPIAARISSANEVAELAYLTPRAAGDDPIARLAEMAKARAGRDDIIASAGPVRAAEPRVGATGWHIQIGAVPTAQGAQELLDRAQVSMGQTLASVQPLTQPVERGGTTLYRARFAGFSDKEAARSACAQLKSRSMSCLAIPN